MLPELFVIVGVIIGSLGSLSYLIDTVRGKVKPNRVSFFLWALAPLVAFFAQIKEGVGIQVLLTFAVGFFPLLIFIASFVNKRAEWKLTRFDLFCGFLSFLGVILWQITQRGDIAIALSIAADGMAAIPTLVKAYKYPETESPWPWITAAISGLLTLLTIKNWTFANYGFALYIFLVDVILFIFVQYKVGKTKS